MFPWNFPTSACAAIYLKSRKRFHAELNPDECAASPESLSSHRSSLPPFPSRARLPPSPARSIPYHPNHPPAAPPRPSKTSSFLSVHRGAWIVADFLWAHSVGHSQRENSLGESLFIFAVARDTWGKIVQLYLVHSSRPSAFPPLHPLPLHLTSTVSLLRLSVSHTSWNVSFFSLYSRLPLCRFFLFLYFVKFTVLHGTRRIRSFNSVNFPSGNLYYIRVLNNYLTRNSAVFCILFAYKDFCENSRVYHCYFLIAIYK